jgi:hypothetical protein
VLDNRKRKYVVAVYTVECRARGWYFWRTDYHTDSARGPNSSLSSVTLMVARQLKREITKRDTLS